MRLYLAIVAIVAASVTTQLYVARPLQADDSSDASAAGDPPPRAAIVFGAREDSTARQPAFPDAAPPDPQLLRPLDLPSRLPMDRADRLREGAKIQQQRMRLERMGDPHDPRVQDRMRRLDRAADRVR